MPENCNTDELVADSRSLCGMLGVNTKSRRSWVEVTCSTTIALCSRMASMMVRAALFRAALEDLEATVNGYISACGWCFPTSVKRLLMFLRILMLGV